jgi:long-chain-fatty-acid--CoA ligase ACSBG
MEEHIKRLHQGISNVMMVGDSQKFNVCLITLKAKGATGVEPGGDELDGHAKLVSPGIITISGSCQDAQWIKSITDAIVKTNKDGNVCISNAAKIQKFTILPHDFSSDTDEFTPTYKLKRSVVAKKYANAIAAIYASSEPAYVPFKA